MNKDIDFIKFLSSKPGYQPSSEQHSAAGVVVMTDKPTNEKLEKECKGVKKMLLESESLYRSLFDNMLNGFAYCRMHFDDNGIPNDFTYLSVNKAFEDLTGLKDVVGKKVSEVIPGIRESDENLIEIYGRVSQSGLPERFELFVVSLQMWFLVSVYSPERGYFVAMFDVITERKRTEEVLESQHALLTGLINSADDIILFSLDKNYCYTAFNDAHQEEMKRIWNVEIAIGMNLLNCMQVPALRELAKASIDRALRGDAFLEIQHQPGFNVYYEFSWNPIRQHNNIIGVSVFIRDITERKEAEEVLLESERKLREAQEMAHLGFWKWEVKTGDVEWSDEVFRIFCLDPKEFTPHIDSILALSPWPEDHQRDKELINRAIETHTPGSYEQKFLRPDKSVGYYYSTFQGNYDENGELISIVGTVLDITERKQAEEALLIEHQRLQQLIDSNIIGVVIVSPGGKVYKANDYYLNMIGFSREEFESGKVDWRAITPLEWLPADEKALKELKEQGTCTPYEKEYLRRDGTRVSVLLADAILPGLEEQIAAFALDITERKRAEEREKNLKEQLWQSQKMEAIGRLSGAIAHDFNNILTTIIGNSEVALMRLMKMEKDSDFKDLLEDIRLAGEKAALLTRQLLAFSRRQILQTEIFSLNRVVLEIDKMLRRLIGEDIVLETNLSPDTGVVEADPSQVEQLIMNLAINARDAMLTGGKLCIETASVELDEQYATSHFPAKPGRYEMISISDTGIGMSKDIQAQIFEPFFTTKPKGKGTGLGLSIVYGIVKQSNGFIWVYSEPGKGTTFKIYLPKVDKNANWMKKSEKRPQEFYGGSETIMVVEDDEMIIKMIMKVLNNCGYTILSATDGNEAIRISEEHAGPIDLVLTDVIMPGMGGKELSNLLKKIRPATKIIYMSGYTDNAIVHHGVLDKGLSFIQKPFTSYALKKKVREALG
jgi:two-component system, cell cycle sensor histidine kinase and response regulator CckA